MVNILFYFDSMCYKMNDESISEKLKWIFFVIIIDITY